MNYLRAVCLVRAMVNEMRFGNGRVVEWSGLMDRRNLLDGDARREETGKKTREGGIFVADGG